MNEAEAIAAAKMLKDFCRAPFCGDCVFLYRSPNTALSGSCRLDLMPKEWEFRGMRGKKLREG